MKKPSSKIREEIGRLQDQLRQAETREAERIGRVALKAGLGETEIDDAEFLAAFEELAARFRKGARPREKKDKGKGNGATTDPSTAVPAGAAQGNGSEA